MKITNQQTAPGVKMMKGDKAEGYPVLYSITRAFERASDCCSQRYRKRRFPTAPLAYYDESQNSQPPSFDSLLFLTS